MRHPVLCMTRRSHASRLSASKTQPPLPMRFLLLVVPAFSLISCAGYHLGSQKPKAMRAVKTISVPMFSNSTLHPRVEAFATSAVTSAFVQDGTYRIVDNDHADARLEGSVASIEYTPIRGSRLDTLLPEELRNDVALKWTLRDSRDPTKLIASGVTVGSSQLFASSNLQTARNSALPEALERAGEGLVSRLSNGY
jgi:Lipopolysaccharide-assembly